jgi:molybdopterin/thiamine biosynthesis adenylyltransferase
VEEATALVLGCGGLGNGVAMGLCRLGVRKLILVDMDDVEATNLNRQILFTKDVVGMRKVDVPPLHLFLNRVVRVRHSRNTTHTTHTTRTTRTAHTTGLHAGGQAWA